VRQELRRFNRILTTAKTDLEALSDALSAARPLDAPQQQARP